MALSFTAEQPTQKPAVNNLQEDIDTPVAWFKNGFFLSMRISAHRLPEPKSAILPEEKTGQSDRRGEGPGCDHKQPA